MYGALYYIAIVLLRCSHFPLFLFFSLLSIWSILRGWNDPLVISFATSCSRSNETVSVVFIFDSIRRTKAAFPFFFSLRWTIGIFVSKRRERSRFTIWENLSINERFERSYVTFLSSYSRKLFNMEATCKTLYTCISLSISLPSMITVNRSKYTSPLDLRIVTESIFRFWREHFVQIFYSCC